jgi:hypothetical protein
MVDDRDQPQHVIIAARSHRPPPWGTRLPAQFSPHSGRAFSSLALLQKLVPPMIVTSGLPSVEIARRRLTRLVARQHL